MITLPTRPNVTRVPLLMRITFVLPTVSMRGGINVIALYARALVARSHRVTLVSTPPQSPSFRNKLTALLKGHGWPAKKNLPPSLLDSFDLHHRVLDTWRPPSDSDIPDSDVVIATWWETAEWVNALSSSKGAKVYFIQGHEIFPNLPTARCHATYRLPLHKIVISEWLKEVMAREYGDHIVDVVPNSVDRSQFFAPIRGKQLVPTIGFMYSTAWAKGLSVSLEAVTILRNQFTGLRVICFGRQRPISSLPLPSDAEFYLSPSQGGLRDLYAQCDVWMTSSRSEGFNLPAIEAMACRTPVVSTKTGWPMKAIITRDNGVLVDIDDATGLARGIAWVLSQGNKKWMSLSLSAYNTATTGSWEESVVKFEDALFNACQRASNGEIAGTPGRSWKGGAAI